jgi:hypothetical protein
MSKVGDMGPWQVSPSGTMWAGAWNAKDNDGKSRSAIHIIDLAGSKAASYDVKGEAKIENLTWVDDNTVSAFVADGKNRIIRVNSAGQNTGKTETPFSEAPALPEASKYLVSVNTNVATVRSDNTNAVGKEVTLPVAKNVNYGSIGAISADGGLFVISTLEDSTGGKQSFYLGNTSDGSSKRIFGSDDLPGRVEGIWVSPSGVLVVCSERDKFDRVIFDIASGKLQKMKAGDKLDIANWPDAPKDMMFVSYSAGYKLPLVDGKVRKLFGFENLTRYDESWRREVQGGRLYPRKDGSYTSVSFAAGAIDIRTIGKDGSQGKEILPRQ